jgi:hypothetical protein
MAGDGERHWRPVRVKVPGARRRLPHADLDASVQRRKRCPHTRPAAHASVNVLSRQIEARAETDAAHKHGLKRRGGLRDWHGADRAFLLHRGRVRARECDRRERGARANRDRRGSVGVDHAIDVVVLAERARRNRR